jgi:hypothetical protein
VAAEYQRHVEPGGAGHWEASLAAIDELLAQSQWQGAGLRVVLSDCWVRYAIVPWAHGLGSRDERLEHARKLLGRAYGDVVSGWEVRVSEAPPETARVACTLPGELLQGVREMCIRRRVRLVSLQSQLVAEYQNWRERLPLTGAWFVTVGEDTLAAARISRRSWDRVHTVRIGTDWTRELKRLQTFGRLAGSNLDEGQVYVDAPDTWRAVAGATAGELHWLEDASRAHGTLGRLARVRRLAA